MRYLIDGMNFFWAWKPTRDILLEIDFPDALEPACAEVGRLLGEKRRETVIFLDGGLKAGAGRLGGMAVRYSGPGRTADDAMVAAAGRHKGRMLLAVTSDRELAGRLRAAGCEVVGTATFAAQIEEEQAREDEQHDPIPEEKTRLPDEDEVNYWLDEFGGDQTFR